MKRHPHGDRYKVLTHISYYQSYTTRLVKGESPGNMKLIAKTVLKTNVKKTSSIVSSLDPCTVMIYNCTLWGHPVDDWISFENDFLPNVVFSLSPSPVA